jgi:quinohemoprotein ethanol dehydrogenase
MKRLLIVAIGTASLLILHLLNAGVATEESIATNPSETPSDLNWQYHGNDLGNARYQDVDVINRSNVADLVPLWIFHTGLLDERSSFEVSPIVVNGVMYISTGHDDVYALNATTGEEIWAYHPLKQMPPLDELSICCGRDSRGVAYGDGKIFIGRLDAVLVALDATTGEVIWETEVEDWREDFTITMAPQFVRGKVITGVSGGEFEVRGSVSAFDAKTGRRDWKFFTTQPTFRGEPTWAGASWRHGGAPVWTTPAVDAELGLIYITTGNASPDLNGINREGNNLFTASIVALDIDKGQYRWHFQEIHHDIWDYDGPQPPVLFTFAGSGVPALSHCSKSGDHFILDRRTGEPLHPVEERAVPEGPAFQHASPTQPMSSVEALTPMQVESVPAGTTAAERYTPPQPTPC